MRSGSVRCPFGIRSGSVRVPKTHINYCELTLVRREFSYAKVKGRATATEAARSMLGVTVAVTKAAARVVTVAAAMAIALGVAMTVFLGSVILSSIWSPFAHFRYYTNVKGRWSKSLKRSVSAA